MWNIDLKGKKAFIAGVGDDQGFGWAIAKSLAEAGAEILIGTWVPVVKIFTMSLKSGKFDNSRKLSDGSLMEFSKIYPIDASYDFYEDVPEEIKNNKRYLSYSNYAISDVAKLVEKEHGKIDILVHSLANAPEVTKPLLDTSRKGYLSALNSSAYSLISLVSHFGPIMKKSSSILSLSFIASEKVIPGYGGGMSSAKAALESDTRTLAWEIGKKWDLRINAISAGPLKSRAAKAIGIIDYMMTYAKANAPLSKELLSKEIADTALFLLSDKASAITGNVVYVDNGINIMGLAMDSKTLEDYKV
jgi:enoyl-[acyl-carrier protein] reductase I